MSFHYPQQSPQNPQQQHPQQPFNASPLPPINVSQDLCVYCFDVIFAAMNSRPVPDALPRGYDPNLMTPLFVTLTIVEQYPLNSLKLMVEQ